MPIPVSPPTFALALAIVILCAAGVAILGGESGLLFSDRADTDSQPSDRTLVIAHADSEERLASIPVENGTTVVLSYVHSVEKTEIDDVYVVNGSEIEMTRMEFDAFGAGLPTDANRTDDGYVVYRNERYEQLFVSPSGHELVVGDEEATIGDKDGNETFTTYDLDDLSDGDSVVLRIERTNGSPTVSPSVVTASSQLAGTPSSQLAGTPSSQPLESIATRPTAITPEERIHVG